MVKFGTDVVKFGTDVVKSGTGLVLIWNFQCVILISSNIVTEAHELRLLENEILVFRKALTERLMSFLFCRKGEKNE